MEDENDETKEPSSDEAKETVEETGELSQLFGNDDDVSEEGGVDERTDGVSPSARQLPASKNPGERRDTFEAAEEEDEEGENDEDYFGELSDGDDRRHTQSPKRPPTQQTVTVSLPQRRRPPLDSKIVVVRCPPQLSIATKIFDPKKEIASVSGTLSEGAARGDVACALLAKRVERLRQAQEQLEPKDTIRFKMTEDNGQQIIESNTNWVEWSDGSTSIVVGDQIFDVGGIQVADGSYMFECSDQEYLVGHVPVSARAQLRSVVFSRAPMSRGTPSKGTKTPQKRMRVATEEETRRSTLESEAQVRRQTDITHMLRGPRGSTAWEKHGLTATELESSDEEGDSLFASRKKTGSRGSRSRLSPTGR